MRPLRSERRTCVRDVNVTTGVVIFGTAIYVRERMTIIEPEISRMNVPVPPLNLAGNFKAVREEVLAELTAIADSGFYVLGPRVEAFERALAEYCGSKYALGVSSGTDALLLAMMALGIGPGDEVIVPSFTFFATGGCVSRLGAKPVFCDVDPHTFNIDPQSVERLMTPRTRAIIPVHLYGELADMAALEKIAAKRGLYLIEDAAQAIGAREPGSKGRQAGSIGTFGCLSFYPTKNLGAMGDAGALLTNDEALFQRARQLRLHGETRKYHHQFIGGNFRIDVMQAAVLHVKLRRLEEWTEQRRARATYYTELLRERVALQFVQPPIERNGRHVFHQYVIRAQRRDDLAAFLQQRSIGCGIYYPVPLHLQECFADLGGKAGDLTASERAAKEVLALPIYPELTETQQQSVVNSIYDFYAA
jgi:dTDP-4-amino-4,6-dideoxygalactose transaminase